MSAPAVERPRSRTFHALRVAAVDALADDAAAITFEVPDELREQLAFDAGQSLTVRRVVDGVEHRRSYSICAPVGGSAGAEMNGQNTGAWSLVIRHADAGALAAAQPLPCRAAPRREAYLNRRGSLVCGSGAGTVGRSCPKSASSRAMSRPSRRRERRLVVIRRLLVG